MKVTFATGIFWPEIGGPATYVKKMAEELTSQGIRVDVVTRSKKLKYKEDKEFNFPIYRVKNTFKFISYLLYLLTLYRRAKDSDVIFAQGPISSGYPALLINKFLKKRFVIKIVGDYAWEIAQNSGETTLGIDEFQKSIKRGRVKKLYNLQSRVCKSADLVITPSNYLANLVSGWGVDKEKIKVVYNSVEFSSSRLEKEDARKEIGISGNIILSIGRLVPWKGFKMLIKIFPRLLKLNQFFRLVIVGDGPDRKNLESMINNLGLNKIVYLVGSKSKEDLATYLAASDLFALNTSYEGFSHQILEVMSAGVPIITTDVGGNKEIMEHGKNGFVVEYNDEEALIDAIKMVAESEDLKRKFILEGKKTSKLFVFKKMAEETMYLLFS